MKTYIDYAEISQAARRKITSAAVIPRPIAWITTVNENGSINVAPFSFFTMISPSILMVSFVQMKDRRKDTFENIMRSKQAVVNIGDISLIEAIDNSSITIPYNESELAYIDVNLGPAKQVMAPLILEAPIAFEVEFLSHEELDDNGSKYDLTLLRILASHINSDLYDSEKHYVRLENPLSRLEGPKYGSSTELEYIRKF